MRWIKHVLPFVILIASLNTAFAIADSTKVDFTGHPIDSVTFDIGNRVGNFCGLTNSYEVIVTLDAKAAGFYMRANAGAPAL